MSTVKRWVAGGGHSAPVLAVVVVVVEEETVEDFSRLACSLCVDLSVKMGGCTGPGELSVRQRSSRGRGREVGTTSARASRAGERGAQL